MNRKVFFAMKCSGSEHCESLEHWRVASLDMGTMLAAEFYGSRSREYAKSHAELLNKRKAAGK